MELFDRDDSLNRAGAVAEVLIEGAARGVAESAEKSLRDPETAAKVAVSALVGAGLGYLTKKGGLLGAGGAMIGASFMFSLAQDVLKHGQQTAIAVQDTWNNPEHAEQNKATIAQTLGPFTVDFFLMSAGGYAGARGGAHFGKWAEASKIPANEPGVGIKPEVAIGQSPWMVKTPAIKQFPTLMGEHRADIAIVGGGISGSVLVEALSRQGARVILLERGLVGSAQTAQMGGIVTRAVDAYYAEIHSTFGEANTRRLSQLTHTGIDYVKGLAC